MESQFSSQNPITKLSSITRNLSGSLPSRPVFESFKSITDYRKNDLEEDLSKKFFGVLSKDNRNDSLKDLMINEFEAIKSKQKCLTVKTHGFPKDNLYKDYKDCRDQSVQTDIREFAKIKLSSGLCEDSSNYMQFAEEFLQELESECSHNSMDLTSIGSYRNRETDINVRDNQFNGNTISTDKRFNYEICNTKHISNQINRLSISESLIDMKTNYFPLILDSKVVEYEANNCEEYEFGEEAIEDFETQFNESQFYPKMSSNIPSNDVVGVQSVKWSDLVQLIKFNKLPKLKNIEKYFK